MDEMQEMGGEAAPMAQGYQICIAVGPDGKLSVGVEGGATEAEEGEAEPVMKPAATIKDAMQIAMSIYQNDGKMVDDRSDADFNSGFGKKPPAPVVDKINQREEMM